MKEFIEKLIGRLEELKTFKLALADAMSELMKKDKLDNYISKEEGSHFLNLLGFFACFFLLTRFLGVVVLLRDLFSI